MFFRHAVSLAKDKPALAVKAHQPRFFLAVPTLRLVGLVSQLASGQVPTGLDSMILSGRVLAQR